MKVAVRFDDGSKSLLDDHVDTDNTEDIKDVTYLQEYKQYIENLLRKKVVTTLFEVVTVAEPKLA
jgi:hypothetical protein